MAAPKFRVSDVAKRMGKSEKALIFQLQSLGADVNDASQVLEPDVIQALITGKKLTTRSRSVIMREDKPQVEKKKEAVRPPRPIVQPPARKKVEKPAEEAPATPAPPPVIIPEFIQAAEAEEREAREAPAPEVQPKIEKPRPMPAIAAEQPAAQPAAAAPAQPHTRPAPESTRQIGPTGPRARTTPSPRPNYAGQAPVARPAGGMAARGTGAPMGPRPAGPGGATRPGGPGARPMTGRPSGPGGARPSGPGMGMRGPGAGP